MSTPHQVHRGGRQKQPVKMRECNCGCGRTFRDNGKQRYFSRQCAKGKSGSGLHKPGRASQMWVAPRKVQRSQSASAEGSWWAEAPYRQDRAAFMAKAESLFPCAPAEMMQLPEWIAS